MPTFVEITPDPFASQFAKETGTGQLEEGGRAAPGAARSFGHVRRPVRGIQVKEDTYATIQVRTANGELVPMWDGGGEGEDDISDNISTSTSYSNFLLQQMQEQRTEKTQVVQTFGEPFIFFFGEHPRIIQGQGILINTDDFNWRAEFWANYDQYLRGTRCIQNKTRVTLSWDDIVIEGYFLSASATETSQNPNHVNFQFQFFLTNYANVSTIGANEFPSSETYIDPLALDVPGLNAAPSTSKTAEVRQLNFDTFTQSQQKNSLFQSLRDNLSAVTTFEGRLEALFNLTSQFIGGGKRVRVPTGFAGGSVFDTDTQIALASVNADNRQIILSNASDPNSSFRTVFGPGSSIGKMAVPVKYGKFRLAVDEYIDTYSKAHLAPLQPIKLLEDQEADYKDIERKVAQVFKDYGIDVDPPAEPVNLAGKLTFGAVQLNTSGVVGLAVQPAARTIL